MTQLLILDHQNDEILESTTEFYNDNHREMLENNQETFDFSVIPTSKIAPFLGKKNRVIIPVEDGFFREFIITNAKQFRGSFEVNSSASYIELKKDEPIAPTVLNGQTVDTATDFVLARSDWKRGITEYAGSLTIEFEDYIDPFGALKQVANAFGLELRFRIETRGNKVVGRYVDLTKKQGEWRGKEIVSGKDLINTTRTESADPVVTALYGVYRKEDGTFLVVQVTNEEARQNWGRKGKHLWGTYVPNTNEELTKARLTELTERELQRRISAHVEYEIDGADIEHIFGREHEKVRLGDSARIKATEYNPPIYLDSRIIAREGPIKVKAQKKYTLGEFIEYSEEDINAVRKVLEKKIAKKISEGQLLEYAERKIHEGLEPPDDKKQKWLDKNTKQPILREWDDKADDWVAITRSKLEEMDGQVSGPQIADNAVEERNIIAGAITEEKMKWQTHLIY